MLQRRNLSFPNQRIKDMLKDSDGVMVCPRLFGITELNHSCWKLELISKGSTIGLDGDGYS